MSVRRSKDNSRTKVPRNKMRSFLKNPITTGYVACVEMLSSGWRMISKFDSIRAHDFIFKTYLMLLALDFKVYLVYT